MCLFEWLIAMSYLVLARKYRPRNFAEVSGQEHVTRTLINSIRRDKVGHAYLFAGPRGVGKTSIARIFAKALTCVDGPSSEPAADDPNCLAIDSGTSLAVREIDGASHNSVDNVRDLIDSFRAVPPPGWRFKIYIIDEVHMLSTAAFNALLKSLEEPPPNTVFILATTESHKIPDTVISRCQRHDFRSLSHIEIEDRLRQVATAEKLEVEPEVFRTIARLADGSMRDAQSLLDRVHSFCDGALTAAEMSEALGVVERKLLFELSAAIFSHDSKAVLENIQASFSTGMDPSLYLADFASHFRELLVAKHGGEKLLVDLGVPELDVTQLMRQVESESKEDVQDIVQIAREGADTALRSAYPKYSLESLVVRLAERQPVVAIGELLGDILSGTAKLPVGSSQPRPKSPIPKRSAPASKSVQATSDSRSIKAIAAKMPEKTEESPDVQASSGSLDWTAFIRSVKGEPILAEHLKRLMVVSFKPGVLEVKAPEFSKTYVEQRANSEKFVQLLKEFTSVDAWKVDVSLGKGSGGVEAGSLLHQEREKVRKTREEREQELVAHPHVKSIEEHFPGSTIESIKVRE